MNSTDTRRMTVLALAIASLTASAAWGDVGCIVSAADLQQVFENQSVALAPTNSISLLVADTTGSGFSTFVNPYSPLSPGSYLTGDKSGNLIIARWDLNSLNKSGQVLGYATATLGGGLATGKALALYWFPTRSAAATIVGYSDYGIYTDSVGVDSSDPWFVPADGQVVQLNFYTASRGGSNPDSAGRATLGVLDPVDPGLYPTRVSLDTQGTNTVLTFTSYMPQFYDVLSTTDLVSGTWSVIAPNLYGNNITFTNFGGAIGPQRFYRLHAQ